MTTIEQSALLPFSAQKMFDLVNDFESYPLFMDGCLAAEIISESAKEITGRLELGKAGFKYSLTTQNFLSPPKGIEMKLLSGPFKHFKSNWHFVSLNENACKVSLLMEFEFSLGLADVALKGMFDSSSKNLVNAVCKRAELLYGEKQ